MIKFVGKLVSKIFQKVVDAVLSTVKKWKNAVMGLKMAAVAAVEEMETELVALEEEEMALIQQQQAIIMQQHALQQQIMAQAQMHEQMHEQAVQRQHEAPQHCATRGRRARPAQSVSHGWKMLCGAGASERGSRRCARRAPR